MCFGRVPVGPGAVRAHIVQAREWPVPGWTLAKQEGEPGEDHSERPHQGQRLEGAPGAQRVSSCSVKESMEETSPRGGFPCKRQRQRYVSHGHPAQRGQTDHWICAACLPLRLSRSCSSGALQEHLKTSLLPKSETFLNLRSHTQALRAPWTTRAWSGLPPAERSHHAPEPCHSSIVPPR